MTFNAEEALEGMVYVTQLNDANETLTVYAIVCPEHGGFVTRSAPEAIAAAVAANANENGQNGSGCTYYAIAIGIRAGLVNDIFAPPPEGS